MKPAERAVAQNLVSYEAYLQMLATPHTYLPALLGQMSTLDAAASRRVSTSVFKVSTLR